MADASRPLSGLRVLVTRPEHQAQALCRAIEDDGGQTIRLPLLAIDGPLDSQAATDALQDNRQADLWVFTSANAVRWAARLDSSGSTAWPATLAAAGQATARALHDLGQAKVRVPAQDGASGLLRLAELQADTGHSVLIVRGEHPLPQLEKTLCERGLDVRTVEVYRRRALHYPAERMMQALDNADVIVISSGESLRQLHVLTPVGYREQLLKLQLAVPSNRVLQIARQLGFRQTPLVPARVSNKGYVKALAAWHRPSSQNPGNKRP